ncbi:MAG: PilZ domain-containing protein [Desulfobacter sp.]|nr:MAG: PilZ domain-containing protein [Desulfobacter sp.]
MDIFINEKCYNIQCRQHQRISVDLQFEILFLSNEDQAWYVEKYGLPEAEGIDQTKSVSETDDAEEMRIRVKDISVSGMQFQTGYYFPLDNFVMLKILIRSIDLSVLSRVVRIKHRPMGTGYVMGVEFVNMKMTEREKLLRYVQSLSTEEKKTPLRFY